MIDRSDLFSLGIVANRQAGVVILGYWIIVVWGRL